MPAMAGQHAMGGHHQPAGEPCDTNDCAPQHAGMHGCVFVMTAVSILAGLVLLYWVGVGRTPLNVSQLRQPCRRRERSPPWTVLTLSELSILRV
jgi:hypothetical protein